MSARNRDQILGDMMQLDCDITDPDSFGVFVTRRAVLLGELDALKEPWTQAQKSMLQEALVRGAQVLADAHKERQQLARKIDRLRGTKRAARGYSVSLPARFKKLF
jgi:hypothetical protein